MYLFSRTRVVRTSKFAEAMAYAPEIAAKVTSISGVEVAAWAEVLSPHVGTIAWTASYESLSDWETMVGKLGADSTYADMVVGADSMFVEGTVDGLLEVVYASPEMPEAKYVSAVRAVAAPGKLAAAMQQGVAIAQSAEQLGGLGVIFASAVTGPYGGAVWYVGAESIGALESARHAMNADPGFVALIDSGNSFQPSGESAIYMRIG